MPDSSLVKKLRLKPEMQAAVIDAPDGYAGELIAESPGVTIVESLDGRFDWIQIFVKNRSELERAFPLALAALGTGGMIWISFPKGASKLQTDLTRDQGWDVVKAADLQWLTLISVNETWSAFSVRREKGN